MAINLSDEGFPEWLTSTADTVDLEIRIVDTYPLTKYERAAVLGRRAIQLSQGAEPRAVCTSMNPLDIAQAELDAGVCPPMRVMRYLPDGVCVQRQLSDLVRNFRRVRLW